MVDKNSLFGGMITTLGAAKKTNCDALGIPWEPRYMLIGDANGTDPVPNPSQTKLVNQVYRAQINQLRVSPTDKNILIAEVVLPPDVGGWWVRELALEDKDGVFSAVANAPPSYKPVLEQGSGRNQVVRMHIITSGTSNILLKIDPSVVLATRQYVDEAVGGLLPADKVAGTYTKVIVDDRGVFLSGSNPNTLEGYGIAPATKQQAEAGTDEAAPMTALRVLQAITKFVVQATEAVRGIAKIATSVQVAAGTDDATFVTPKKLRGAGLGLSGIRTEDLSGANVVLAAADAGSLVVFGGTGGGSLTLPKANSVRAGASITIHAASAVAGTNTLKPAAGDTLSGMLQFVAPAGVMRSGDSVVCTTDGTSNWVISVDCTYNYVAQAVAQLFASGQSLAQAAGYQKLPGGLIDQWGIFSYTAAGTQALSIPLPIAFPNQMLSAMVTTHSRLNNTAVGADPVYTSTKSSLSLSSITSSGSGAMTVFYMCKGN